MATALLKFVGSQALSLLGKSAEPAIHDLISEKVNEYIKNPTANKIVSSLVDNTASLVENKIGSQHDVYYNKKQPKGKSKTKTKTKRNRKNEYNYPGVSNIQIKEIK